MRQDSGAVVRLSSGKKDVLVSRSGPVALVGERLVPTNRPRLEEAVRMRDPRPFVEVALDQQASGADLIDLNVGGDPRLDREFLPAAAAAVAEAVECPLALDTMQDQALQGALKGGLGRPLINSVWLCPGKTERRLDLAGSHHAAVILMPLEQGRPPAQDPEERLRLVVELVRLAREAGLGPEDLIADAMVISCRSPGDVVRATLETLRLYRRNLDFPSCAGVSNVSHGMAGRWRLDAAFAAMAIEAGADMLLLNPFEPAATAAVRAAEVLLRRRPPLAAGDEAEADSFVRTARRWAQERPLP